MEKSGKQGVIVKQSLVPRSLEFNFSSSRELHYQFGLSCKPGYLSEKKYHEHDLKKKPKKKRALASCPAASENPKP
jgi:hypothetical protein